MAGVKGAGAWLLVMAMALALSCVAVGAARTSSSRSNDITEIRFEIYVDKQSTSKVFGPAPTQNSDENFGKGKVKDYSVVSREQEQERSSQDERDERERNSRREQEIGRARGLYFYDSKDGDGLQELFTVSFYEGQYAGNSLTFGGHWDLRRRNVELAVTGGTGDFSFARGSAEFRELERDSDRASSRDSDNRAYAYEVRVQLLDANQNQNRRGLFF